MLRIRWSLLLWMQGNTEGRAGLTRVAPKVSHSRAHARSGGHMVDRRGSPVSGTGGETAQTDGHESHR